MSANLEEVVSKVKELSSDELLTVQETVTAELRRKLPPKITPNQPHTTQEREALLNHYFMPRPTLEELKAGLDRIFPAHLRAQMGQTDFSKLPTGPKSLSEMIVEDREDRL